MKEYNTIEYTQEIAKRFVGWMTEGGLVSDEVLFSSIGESWCRDWAVQNALDQGCEPTAEFIQDDENWKRAVLVARYGREVGIRKYYEEHTDFDQDLVEKLLAHLF